MNAIIGRYRNGGALDRQCAADAIERLCFIAKIEEGLRQSAAGRLVSHDEVKRQFVS